jgi:hypothetical protein
MSGEIGGEGISSGPYFNPSKDQFRYSKPTGVLNGQGMPKLNPTTDNKTSSDILKDSTPSFHEKFKPHKKDDNMMAENDPVKRQPENWQTEAKKDLV